MCVILLAPFLLPDGVESPVRVPGWCLRQRHGTLLWALLRPHKAQQGQPGLPCGWLALLHVALLPSSPAGAPPSPGGPQAGLTAPEGEAAAVRHPRGPSAAPVGTLTTFSSPIFSPSLSLSLLVIPQFHNSFIPFFGVFFGLLSFVPLHLHHRPVH